ncbi:MAG: insulinase family protein [Bacteroidetes bacterium]|nr:insulinase family protein [Bacteroidota bacterium]
MKKLLICTVLLATVAISQAQKNWPSNIFFTKLDNGLQVLVLEDASVPLATVEIAVHNGAFTEDTAYNGLSHLYEHMFFKANKDIPSQEKYLDRIHELGIVFNGTTGDERVNYFFTLGSKQVSEGLKFLNSAVRYPLFLQEEMKKENPVVDGEFQRAESNPGFALFDKYNHKMWGNLYSRKNAIGDHQVILTCTPEKMRTIKDKYYYPNNSLLLVAGAVNHEDIFQKAKEIFGDWKPSDFDPFQKWPIPEFAPLNTKDSLSFVVTNPNARVPVLLMGWHGPDTRNDVKGTVVADVFSFILNQKSSKFQKALIDSGYALAANLNYQSAKYVGPITLQYVPNPGKFNDAFRALQKEIDQFDAPDYFTDEQLETSKIKLANNEKYGEEVTTQYIHTLSFWWCSASLDYYFNYISEIKKVTRRDIIDYVHKYIKGQPCVKGLLLNQSMQDKWKVTDLDNLFK